MIRYLIVYRVNAPMIWFHLFPPVEFSLGLGTIISESLPTVQARPWREALEPWKPYAVNSATKEKNLKHPLSAAWPIESVIFFYPGKRAYGEGELILMELKLMGEAANHSFFLEVILPAIERASRTIDKSRQRPDALWGKFDIQNIYVAHGAHWDTLADDCKLDLKYVATPDQWFEGLNFAPPPERTFQDFTWVTPFDLRTDGNEGTPCRHKKVTPNRIPSLKDILVSFQNRMNSLSSGKPVEKDQFQEVLNGAGRLSLEDVIDLAADVPMMDANLYPVLESQPGCWTGNQKFDPIPEAIIPYLSLASIFHIGAHAHLGCGTFLID